MESAVLLIGERQCGGKRDRALPEMFEDESSDSNYFLTVGRAAGRLYVV